MSKGLITDGAFKDLLTQWETSPFIKKQKETRMKRLNKVAVEMKQEVTVNQSKCTFIRNPSNLFLYLDTSSFSFL